MNNYSIALFLHITGAMGLFAVLAIEWLGLWQIRSAVSPEQVRAWMGILKSARKAGFVSMLTTVISGFYMMDKVWGNTEWIKVTLGSLILVIALSIVLTGPRMVAIGRALTNEKGLLSQTFYSLTNHPLLWISIQTRIAITLGIVFLKIDRPDLDRALLTIGVATVLGLVSALPMPRREHAQAGAVD
jgi:protein-S-isoprenylcysteine O-methyltransferase Ste14